MFGVTGISVHCGSVAAARAVVLIPDSVPTRLNCSNPKVSDETVNGSPSNKSNDLASEPTPTKVSPSEP